VRDFAIELTVRARTNEEAMACAARIARAAEADWVSSWAVASDPERERLPTDPGEYHLIVQRDGSVRVLRRPDAAEWDGAGWAKAPPQPRLHDVGVWMYVRALSVNEARRIALGALAEAEKEPGVVETGIHRIEPRAVWD
jgi:hypothetical protein